MSAEADKALGKAQGGNNSQGPIYRVPVSPGNPPYCLLCQGLVTTAIASALAALSSSFLMFIICLAAGISSSAVTVRAPPLCTSMLPAWREQAVADRLVHRTPWAGSYFRRGRLRPTLALEAPSGRAWGSALQRLGRARTRSSLPLVSAALPTSLMCLTGRSDALWNSRNCS